MKIAHKLFLTLVGVVFLILLVNLLMARWSFQQGFLNFVISIEQQRLQEVSTHLATEYRMSGNNWNSIREMGAQGFLNNYRDELRSKARPPRYHGERGAKRAPPPDRARAGERPPPPHESRLPEDRRLERRNPSHALGGKGPNTALFDSQGEYVIGEDMSSSGAPDVSVDIVSEGKRIGELRSWPNAEGFTLLATEFSKQQLLTSLLIASGCLFVAGVVSWFVSKRLLKPLNLILNAVSTLSNGKFDVTFAHKRSDELGQLMRDIEFLSKTLDKNRSAKSRWFADISHELRTPLTVLRGEIDVLKAGIRSFDQQQLASFDQEIALLRRLVDDLYALSLSDIGGLRYAFERLDLSVILAIAVDSLHKQASDKGLDITFKAEEEMWVNADKQRLEQLFINLCRNSLAYTDAPGKLHIVVEKRDTFILVTFEDSAPGVASEDCEALFDPLHRQDESRTRRGSGAGLGLTISRNIVEAHGGEIFAVPSVLGGLKICVRLKAQMEA
ncbi:MAG: HAMP domain-containing protein [Alteromonadaceae bacterium]|nr:HAMP domain-containing protein [Alteromonadaceae bacterium]